MDEHNEEPAAPRRRSTLLLAVGLVTAAAALVLAVLPEPEAIICNGGCVSADAARREVVAVVTYRGEPAAPPVAAVFRSIRAADADGSAPPIPPSEIWPAQ